MAKRRSLSDRVTDSFRVLTELDLSHAYERQAGTIALLVIGLALLAILIATGAGWAGESDTIPVEAELPSAGGLAGGDPVLIRGVPVGRVESVQLVGPGRVRISLSLERAYAPRRDASVELVALDLVGNQGVTYDPGRAADPLPADVPVVGSASVTLTEQFEALGGQAAELLVRLREVDPEELSAEIGRTRKALAGARVVAEAFPMDSLAVAVRAAAVRGDALIASFDSLRASFPRAALTAQRESLAINAAELFANVGEVQGSLDRLRDQVARGEGNAGRFTRDSTFRNELDAARTSLRLLMEKFLGRRPAEPPPP